MRSHDDYSDIGERLRSHKPDVAAPPGLESRILRALDRETQPRKRSARLWIWLALPPAFAALLLVLNLRKPEPAPVVERFAPVSQPTSADSLLEGKNPLLAEREALSRDLERVSGFVINCMPSLKAPGP